MRDLTRDENLAVAACMLIVAINDDTMRELSAEQRIVALGGKRKAEQMLVASGVSPSQLKDLAYDIMERRMKLTA